MSTAHPILYSFRRCPYAMRARLALLASRTRCELREVVLRDKPAAMLTASPKGTVPVLVLEDGTVIDESLDIILWSLARNDPDGWLQPDGGTRDQMLALIAHSDGPFKQALDAYKYAASDDQTGRLTARANGAEFLRALDARLCSQPHLFGERLSLADIAIFPFVRQFANVDRAWFDAGPWRHLRFWLNTRLAASSFEVVMKKYAKWRPGEPIVMLK